MRVVIQLDRLSKRYRLGTISTGSLRHDLNRWWHRVRGREDPYSRVTEGPSGVAAHEEPDEVWALREVCLEVEEGETLGIIGRNGAGKSTLLKILSRITAPTGGIARVRGRIASLLEVGTGFHPDLTGRENIYLNGAVLGMTRPEIRAKLDAIIAFSGCERFIDTPVKRYSSGMVVRLGFAVAAHLEPEILIVDEVLAVGDAEFQRKCLGKMGEVANSGRTILFVSHNLGSIQSLCRTAVWLDRGRIVMGKADSAAVVGAYERAACAQTGVSEIAPGDHRMITPFQIIRVETLDREGRPTPVLRYGEPAHIRLVCRCAEAMDGVRAGIALRGHGVLLATLRSPPLRLAAQAEPFALDCTVPGGALLPGLFEMDVGADRGGVGLDYVRSAAAFTVAEFGVDDHWIYDRRDGGLVRIPNTWQAAEGAAKVMAK